jgi:Acyl carrier protein
MFRSFAFIQKMVGFTAQKTVPLFRHQHTFMAMSRFSTIQQGGDASQILEEVEAKIFQIISSGAKCKRDKLTRTATFTELGFDSLDGVELVVAMEEHFGVTIEDEEASRIESVQDAIAIFHKYMIEKYNRDKLAEREEEKGVAVKGEKEK